MVLHFSCYNVQLSISHTYLLFFEIHSNSGFLTPQQLYQHIQSQMNLLNQIVSHIIRPTRDHYKPTNLGQQNFTVKSKVDQSNLSIKRQDAIILNKYNQKLHLSFYKIDKRFLKQNNFPCVIYLHANNGSRIQGLTYLKSLLEQEFNVALFDCTGSGISDGEYITLGLRESQDLECIIEYLLNKKKIKNMALWGRSMGAVTALLYANKHIKQLKVCIYDSPFYSLKKLIKEIASEKTGLPKIFFKPFMPMIEEDIKNKTSVNINDLKLKNRIQSITCAGLFITSKKDKLVNYLHTQNIYNLYRGEKEIHYIQTEHQQSRPKQIIQTCIQFLKERFHTKEVKDNVIKNLRKNEKMNFIQEKNKSKTIHMQTNVVIKESKQNKKINNIEKSIKPPQIRSIHSISTSETQRLFSGQKTKDPTKISVSSLKNLKNRPISTLLPTQHEKRHINIHQQYNPLKQIPEAKSPKIPIQKSKMLKKSNPINVLEYKNNFVCRMNSQNNITRVNISPPVTKISMQNIKKNQECNLINAPKKAFLKK